MSIPFLRSGALSLPVLLGLGIVAAIAGSTGTTDPAPGGIQCGISKTTQHGMLALEGTIVSPTALDGQYRFAIRSSGNGNSSTINQGGPFTIAANQPTPVGKVMINAGSTYDVDFTVTAAGQTLDCGKDLATKL